MRLWPIVLLAAGLFFLLYIDAPNMRHAAVLGLGNCSVQQYYGIPANPDFLALGSSRVRQGIAPEEIGAESNGRLTRNYNLGRSGLSSPRDYIVLRDLLERGVRPRAVYFELDLNALLRSTDVRLLRVPQYVALLKYSDLYLLQKAQPNMNSVERAQLTALTGLEKLRGAIVAFASGAPFGSAIPVGQAPHHCRPQDVTAPGIGQRLRAHIKRAQEPETDRQMLQLTPDSAEARQVLFFLAGVRALCQQYGIALVVARPGAIGEPGLGAADEAAVKALAPEFVQPPRELAREIWADFDDETHMGSAARVRYTRWLAKVLMERTGA
jgi:hypothetical protein